MALNDLFRADRPVVDIRGVHLDLKGTPPTPDRLMELLALLAELRYNALLVEWEDTFPWQVNPKLRNETAYSREEVDAFHAQAAEQEAALQIVHRSAPALSTCDRTIIPHLTAFCR